MNAVRNVAIVTGTSQGIGNYVTDAAEAEKVVSEISSAGGQAVAIQADLSQQADVARLFEQTERQLGGVDAPFAKRPFRVHIDPTTDGEREFARADGAGKPTRLLRASDRYNAQMIAELDSACTQHV